LRKLLLFGLILLAACDRGPAPVEKTYAPPELILPQVQSEHSWEIDEDGTSIAFNFLEKGQSHQGKFDRFEIAIDLDLENPKSGQITALIDLVSVDAGTPDRNKVLRDSEMFFVEQFPIARFHSQEIVRLDMENFEARGELSLKDIRKAIVLPFSITHNGKDAIAKARFEMDRLDFGIGTGSFMGDKYVGYPITVEIEVRARKRNVEESIQ